MPVYLDLHEQVPDWVSLEEAERIHGLDLAGQARHGVTFQRYWIDLAARKMFCLLQAPDAHAAVAVHREGHGLLANRIYAVVEGH